jgi:hypothetical protein
VEGGRTARTWSLALSSSAELKNECSYTSTPPVRLNGVHRDNFLPLQTVCKNGVSYSGEHLDLTERK